MGSNKAVYNIRPVREDECEALLQMIKELAEFVEIEDFSEISNTAEGLKEDLFGTADRCACLVAENTEDNRPNNLVGFALYFFAYSTWQRTFVHLEDLYVRAEHRGKGVGKKLYQGVTKVAVDRDCQRVELTVLGSNEKALNFYKHVGNIDRTALDGRHKMRLCRKEMEKFVEM